MTAARECAKEAIIGSIQIARNASVPVFTPFPLEPVYPTTLVQTIVEGAPHVGQAAVDARPEAESSSDTDSDSESVPLSLDSQPPSSDDDDVTVPG